MHCLYVALAYVATAINYTCKEFTTMTGGKKNKGVNQGILTEREGLVLLYSSLR
jgi:hypothetical protein